MLQKARIFKILMQKRKKRRDKDKKTIENTSKKIFQAKQRYFSMR